jgi:hypothetical protein
MKKLPLFTIFFIVLVCAYFMKTTAWDGKSGDNWKGNLSGYDTRAYYEYLPDFFIKHNLKIRDSSLQYVNYTPKGLYNKHFIGPAVLWLPIFMVVLEYSRMENKVADGTSALFIKSIGIEALFWLFAGLYCLWKMLELLDISEIIISITLLLITFGTNLFYYSYQQYMMSHMYSFSLLSAFLYTGMQYVNTGKKKYLVWMSFAFGLGLIVRPTALCLLPFLLPLVCGGDLKKAIRTFFTPVTLLVSCSIIIPIVFLQFGVWYLQTGHWFVSAYSDERFYFFHPEIWKVLFSFQNGWFIYTPLAFLSLAGFSSLYRVNKGLFYSCTLAVVAWIYLVASWWCWSYEDGFEHRAFVDIYPIVAIGTVHLFSHWKKLITLILLLICCACLIINLVQTYQCSNNILTSYKMDWNSYKYVFLKTSDKYANCLGGQKDLPLYNDKPPHLIFTSRLNFAQPEKEWNTKQPEVINGKAAIHFKGDEFGTSLEIPSDSICIKGGRYYTEITLTRFEPQGNSSSGVLMVNDVPGKNGNHQSYTTFKINDYPSGTDSNTRTYKYEFDTPWLTRKDSKMVFYIWNPGHQDFYLTGLLIEVYRF